MWMALLNRGCELKPAFATTAYPLCTQHNQEYSHRASGVSREERGALLSAARGIEGANYQAWCLGLGDAWPFSPFPPLAPGSLLS